MKFLIVDDSRVIREKLKIILMQLGHTVIAEANDGKQAILLFKLLMPEIVTIDLNMGDINGIETMKAMRVIDPQVKAVIISSESDSNVIQEALDAGANTYILKPFDKEKVEAALGGNHV